MLKSKENEFLKVREELSKILKEKEKKLSTTSAAIRSNKNNAELIKRQRFNTEAKVVGFERVN
jgi:hypothetical protein